MFNLIKTATLLTGLALSIIACTGLETVEKDFGNSVREMQTKQTLDPVAAVAPDPDAIDATDGQRLEGTVDAYRADGAEGSPEASSQIDNFNTTEGGGS